jgi:hypothetical protein
LTFFSSLLFFLNGKNRFFSLWGLVFETKIDPQDIKFFKNQKNGAVGKRLKFFNMKKILIFIIYFLR